MLQLTFPNYITNPCLPYKYGMLCDLYALCVQCTPCTEARLGEQCSLSTRQQDRVYLSFHAKAIGNSSSNASHSTHMHTNTIIIFRAHKMSTRWASVRYYERSERVGETFYASGTPLVVDGLLELGSERHFCLGRFEPLRRSDDVEQTHQLIGILDMFF